MERFVSKKQYAQELIKWTRMRRRRHYKTLKYKLNDDKLYIQNDTKLNSTNFIIILLI